MPLASAFDPLSIAGCFAWWDPSDSRTITVSGGVISQLNDKSGNSRNLTAAGSAQPISMSGNGFAKNAIDFTAQTHVLQTANFTQALPVMCFIVAKLRSFTVLGAFDAEMYGNDGSAGFSPYLAFSVAGPNSKNWAIGGNANLYCGIADLNPHVFTGSFVGSSLDTLYIDGAQSGSPGNGTGGTGWSTSKITVGNDLVSGVGSDVWAGQVGEMIFYNSTLSAANQSKVEQYLLQKWITTRSTRVSEVGEKV